MDENTTKRKWHRKTWWWAVGPTALATLLAVAAWAMTGGRGRETRPIGGQARASAAAAERVAIAEVSRRADLPASRFSASSEPTEDGWRVLVWQEPAIPGGHAVVEVSGSAKIERVTPGR